MQGWSNTQKSVNVIHHIKQTGRTKKKHMIISLDAEKAFDKIEHLFMIKVLEKARIQETHLKRIKAVYSKPVVRDSSFIVWLPRHQYNHTETVLLQHCLAY